MIMGWVAIVFPAFGVRLLAFPVLVDADAAPVETEARGGGEVPEADRAVIVPVVRTHVAGEDGDQGAPGFLGLAGNADGESNVRRRRKSGAIPVGYSEVPCLGCRRAGLAAPTRSRLPPRFSITERATSVSYRLWL